MTRAVLTEARRTTRARTPEEAAATVRRMVPAAFTRPSTRELMRNGGGQR